MVHESKEACRVYTNHFDPSWCQKVPQACCWWRDALCLKEIYGGWAFPLNSNECGERYFSQYSTQMASLWGISVYGTQEGIILWWPWVAGCCGLSTEFFPTCNGWPLTLISGICCWRGGKRSSQTSIQFCGASVGIGGTWQVNEPGQWWTIIELGAGQATAFEKKGTRLWTSSKWLHHFYCQVDERCESDNGIWEGLWGVLEWGALYQTGDLLDLTSN